MELVFAPRNILQIDDARICYKNFKGERSMYNQNGDRKFSLIIPDEEIAEQLTNHTNELGAGWNVKIKAPKEPGEAPFRHLEVKLRYTDRSQPTIRLVSGDKVTMLTEQTVGILDDMKISKVDLDIRPYDNESRFGAHRTAYLRSMVVYQYMEEDRFASRFASDDDGYDYDEE